MKIDTLVDIAEGKLLNNPFISSFDKIKTNCNNISRGDLFIAHNTDDIKNAINNGAYGILTDEDIPITDTEIAWVKVDNISRSVKRLIDVSIVHKNNTFILAEPFCYDFLSKIILEKQSMFFLSGDIQKDTEHFFNDSQDLIFVSSNEEYVNYFRKIKYLNKDEISKYKIIKKSLFETSFIYKKRLFENIKISSIFMDNTILVLDYLEDNNMPYALNNIQMKYFQPIFVDNLYKELDYGKSQKVLIFESNTYYFDKQISFLFDARWLNVVIFLPSSKKNTLGTKKERERIFYFKNKKDLKTMIKEKTYQVALILHTKEDIMATLTNTIIQYSLFENFNTNGEA